MVYFLTFFAFVAIRNTLTCLDEKFQPAGCLGLLPGLCAICIIATAAGFGLAFLLVFQIFNSSAFAFCLTDKFVQFKHPCAHHGFTGIDNIALVFGGCAIALLG